MNPNKCRYDRLLSAFFDGALSDSKAAEVRDHIETCGPCRKSLQAMERIDSHIEALPSIEPSSDFDRNFWKKVEALKRSPARSQRRGWMKLGGWPGLAAGMAACCLAVILVHRWHPANISAEDLFIAQNMEFLKEYEMIEYLDILEQMDLLQEESGAS